MYPFWIKYWPPQKIIQYAIVRKIFQVNLWEENLTKVFLEKLWRKI